MEEIMKCLVEHGEELLKALGLEGMRQWYGAVPVNAWYNACHKCN